MFPLLMRIGKSLNLGRNNFLFYSIIKQNRQIFLNRILFRNFTDKTTHYTIPSADPHRPKKGVKKHKEHPGGKAKVEEEASMHQGEDNLLLKIPVRRQDPYVRDIPKVDRHKEDKNTRHKVGSVSYSAGQSSVNQMEDEVEIPELNMKPTLTSTMPTTKVRVTGLTSKAEKGGVTKKKP